MDSETRQVWRSTAPGDFVTLGDVDSDVIRVTDSRGNSWYKLRCGDWATDNALALSAAVDTITLWKGHAD